MAREKNKEQPETVGNVNPEKAKALDSALAQIERQFGKGSVMKMGDRGPQVLEVIPTGSVALDIALGIGGLPRGRRSEEHTSELQSH